MKTLRIIDTHDRFVGERKVADYNEAYDWIFDTFQCCWSVEDLGDVIEAMVYPECVAYVKEKKGANFFAL